MNFVKKDGLLKQTFILFYDGDCGLCAKSVQFILKHEKENHIKFCSLQSQWAIQALSSYELFQVHQPSISSVLFSKWINENNGKINSCTQQPDCGKIEKLWDQSDAVVEVCRFLKFPFSLLKVIHFVPKKLRDFIYILVANNRKRIFSEVCFVPEIQHRERFIGSK